MSESILLDKTFNIIMKRMVESGQAPHYTEIAAELGVPMEEGRKALHDLFSAGVSGWLFPGTDLIASFAPFNNLPTQYRVTIDGQQKWSPSEDSSRWQLAGSIQGKRFGSTFRVWIADCRPKWRCGTESSSKLSPKG